MEHLEKNRQLIRRYLLGDMTEGEQEPFEERVLTDCEYRELVLLTEDELVDDFVDSQLSESEHTKFVEHFLSTPQQLQKVEDARTLRKHAAAAAAARRAAALEAATPAAGERARRGGGWWPLPFLRGPRRLVALAAVAALVIVSLIWLALQSPWAGGRRALDQQLAELNNRDGGAPEASPAVGARAVFPVTLAPVTVNVRETGGTDRIAIPAGADVVQLRLLLPPGTHGRYRATLRTQGGTEVFTLDGLNAAGAEAAREVVLKVPAAALTRDDYILTLDGSTADGRFVEVAEYSFRVTDSVQPR